MSNDNLDETQEFPILDKVVIPGDETVIKTAQLARELQRQIEELDDNRSFLSPADISRAITGQQVEKLINDIVDHHTEALRRDLLRVVSRAVRER